jgi:hypothetical protein
MLRGTGRNQPHMNSQPTPRNEEKLCLLNRDHIISVSESASELTVLTTAGKLTVAGNAAEIAQFRDELANDVRSNFVSIPPALGTIQSATKVLLLLAMLTAIATGVSAGDLEYNLKPWGYYDPRAIPWKYVPGDVGHEFINGKLQFFIITDVEWDDISKTPKYKKAPDFRMKL